MIRFILRLMGYFYCWIEQFVSYPDDDEILGLPIDEDFQKMSRRELCEYIDTHTHSDYSQNFWDLDSTSKIRFGCQMVRLSQIGPLPPP